MPVFFWRAENNSRHKWGLRGGKTALEAYQAIKKELDVDRLLEKDSESYRMIEFNKVED